MFSLQDLVHSLKGQITPQARSCVWRAEQVVSSSPLSSQRYLKPYEEDVVVKFLVQMSNLGQPIRMKFIPSIAFSVTCQRPAVERPLKAPGKN
jgi:hypothetical protein